MFEQLKTRVTVAEKTWEVSTVELSNNPILNLFDSFIGALGDPKIGNGDPYETCVFPVDDDGELREPLVQHYHETYANAYDATEGHHHIVEMVAAEQIDLSKNIVDRMFDDD